jgi:polysaccharide biosynthesis transport protein
MSVATIDSTQPSTSAPAGASADGTHAASASVPGVLLNPAYSLSAHKWLALGAFSAMVAVGLPLSWWLGTPVYSSEAAVYVSPRFLRNLQEDKEQDLQSNSQYREYVQQNVRTINRYDIVADALAGLEKKRAFWQQNDETDRRAVERLQQDLKILPVPETYQIVVGLESNKPEGLADIVNAVVDTYLQKAKSEEFYASDKRLESLGQDREHIVAEIKTNQDRRTQLAQELGVSTFTDAYPNPYDRLLVSAKEALADAVRKRIEADAELTSLGEDAKPTAGSPLAALAREQAAKDEGLTSIQNSLNEIRGNLLIKMSGLTEAHPGRKAAERQIAELNHEAERTFEGLVASYSSNLWQEKRGDSFRLHRVEKDLQLEVDQQASRASWFAQKYEEGKTLGLDIDRIRRRLDAIDDRVNFLSLETQAPGFVRMFSRARPPDLPVKGGRKRMFAFFLTAALCLGLAAPLAADTFDSRIRSARGLHRALGFEPLGWFPERGLADEFAHEQVLRLANRLDQDRQKTGARIFAFTGSAAGAGTTTIVAEAARALSALGLPALVVEANAYRSDHRFSGGSQGLAVVLRGNHDLAEAIVSGGPGAPDHVGVGDVEGKRNLTDIHRLIEVLKVGAESYDLVLIDLPPILLSVDAEYVARTADVVVLVVEAGATTEAQARRAAKALERLEPRAVAAVLNRAQIRGLDPAPLQAVEEYECGRRPQPAATVLSQMWS